MKQQVRLTSRSLRETSPVDMCSADRVAYLCERSVNKVTFGINVQIYWLCGNHVGRRRTRDGWILMLCKCKKIKDVAGCRGIER